MSEPKSNGWASPSILLGVFGMLAGAGGSYISFNNRLSSVEVRVEEKARSSDSRLDRIEAKLDRLIEGVGR